MSRPHLMSYIDQADVDLVLDRIPAELRLRLREVSFTGESRGVRRLSWVRRGRRDITLCAMLPPERWTRASDVLILHGRRVCRPVPLCDRCAVRTDCEYYKRLGAKKRRAT